MAELPVNPMMAKMLLSSGLCLIPLVNPSVGVQMLILQFLLLFINFLLFWPILQMVTDKEQVTMM